MARYLWSYDQVTSLVDFYGFRNKGDASREDLQRRIFQQVDAQIGVSWDQSRVLPYVQQYEFEALLFSDVAVFNKLPNAPRDLIQRLAAIRTNVSTPEDINDGEDTHPSKRISDLLPTYQKRVDGPYLAGKIGLSVIRSECPRFREWIDCLESLQRRNPPASDR